MYTHTYQYPDALRANPPLCFLLRNCELFYHAYRGESGGSEPLWAFYHVAWGKSGGGGWAAPPART